MKKSHIYYPLFLSIFFGIGIWLGGYLQQGTTGDGLVATNSLKKRKLNRLIDLIDQRYVDVINTDSIVDVTVNEIMKNLDPHSVYIPGDALEDVDNNMRGDFVGIGIRFFVRDDSISVLKAIKNGPSDAAGIQGGDKVLYVDGKPLFGKNKVSTDALKGKEGSKVTLGILRPGDEKIMYIPVTRGNVAIVSIDAAYMLTNDLGYIKVNRFANLPKKSLIKQLRNLKKLEQKS